MSVFHHAIARTLPYIPKPLVWQISRRYIAGEQVQDAYRVIEGLNQTGIKGTLDVLGEDVTTAAQVQANVDLYGRVIDALPSRFPGKRPSISTTPRR